MNSSRICEGTIQRKCGLQRAPTDHVNMASRPRPFPHKMMPYDKAPIPFEEDTSYRGQRLAPLCFSHGFLAVAANGPSIGSKDVLIPLAVLCLPLLSWSCVTLLGGSKVVLKSLCGTVPSLCVAYELSTQSLEHWRVRTTS